MKSFRFRRISTFAILLVLSLLLASCRNFFGGVDETNIEKVAEYYYAPGEKEMPSGKKTYHLLSEKSRAQIGEEKWVKASASFPTVNAVKVLRKTAAGGTTYALVSITQVTRGEEMDSAGNKVNKEWKNIMTNSWVLENGKWRRLNFPKTAEEVDRAFKNGDYAAAKAKAEEWLTIDPFAINAYSNLIMAINRGGQTLPKEGARSVNDIVRAVLAVNPEDTTANFIAVSYTHDRTIAKSFLMRLRGTINYSVAASNLSLKYENPRERLAFLEEQDRTPNLIIEMAIALAELKRWEEFRKVATDETFIASTKKYLDLVDTALAAQTAAILGLDFVGAKDRENARIWLDYGVTKDPNNPQIRRLGRALER
jgi:hypothetical protein